MNGMSRCDVVVARLQGSGAVDFLLSVLSTTLWNKLNLRSISVECGILYILKLINDVYTYIKEQMIFLFL